MGRGIAFYAVDRVVLDVISSFQGGSRSKLRRIVRDLPQAQKRNSYKSRRGINKFLVRCSEFVDIYLNLFITLNSELDSFVIMGIDIFYE